MLVVVNRPCLAEYVICSEDLFDAKVVFSTALLDLVNPHHKVMRIIHARAEDKNVFKPNALFYGSGIPGSMSFISLWREYSHQLFAHSTVPEVCIQFMENRLIFKLYMSEQTTYSDIIDSFRPANDAGKAAENQCFIQAVTFAESIMKHLISRADIVSTPNIK